MKEILIVYDDTTKVPDDIKTIIGQSTFGQIILKRKKVFEKFVETIKSIDKNIQIIKYDKNTKIDNENKIIFHIFSNYIIKNIEEFRKILDTIKSTEENLKIMQKQKNVGLVYVADYEKIIEKNIIENTKSEKELNTNAFLDIANYENLLTAISSEFDTRFFNKIESNEKVITKKSTNKNKIKQEYEYYQILPNEMKKWIVEPYNYKENQKTAQYSMKRIKVPDLAIRWTHKAINKEEFTNILDNLFCYINNRPIKKVTKQEYKNIENELYINKVKTRIEELKKHKSFNKLDQHIKNGTDFNSIDEIFEYYLEKYNKYSKIEKNYISVIGHGDLCFANILYNRETNIIKFIDPKGALTEEELWTNPYYDIAKLAHSICGNYDFFNCGSYSISKDKKSNYILKVEHNSEEYENIFKQYVEKNNFNYTLVKIYESSLFLSMLPLHIDIPHKVFGFLLNAIEILNNI